MKDKIAALVVRLRDEAVRMLQEGNLEQQAALIWAAGLVEKELLPPPRPCACA